MPIEGIILQMKSLNIDNVVNFPFPTPPDRQTLGKAETVLTHLGALSMPSLSTGSHPSTIGGQITNLGKAMSLFPLSPRFSKMIITGRQHGCLPYVIAIVSALSIGDPFLHEEVLQDEDRSDDDDDEPSRSHTRNTNAKELLRSRRKRFFQSQNVRLRTTLLYLISTYPPNSQTHSSLGNYSSDIFRLLSVVGAYEIAGGTHRFCEEHFVRPKVCVCDTCS